MSSPIQPSGISLDRHHPRLGVGGEAVSHHHVARQQQLAAALAGVAPPRVRAIAWPSSSSCRDAPTATPSAARKVKAIAPPIRIESASWVKRSITPILSATLTPPITTTNGCAGLSSRLREGVQLGLQQQPRRRRQQVRDALRGGVRAVRRPEGVVHVQVGVGGQLGREAGIVGLLARRRSAGSRAAAARPARRRRRPARPSSSASRSATGRSDSSGLGSPLGRPRCEHTTTVRPPSSSSSMVGSEPRGCGCRRPRAVVAAARSGRRAPARAGPATYRSRDSTPHVILLMRSTTRQE